MAPSSYSKEPPIPSYPPKGAFTVHSGCFWRRVGAARIAGPRSPSLEPCLWLLPPLSYNPATPHDSGVGPWCMNSPGAMVVGGAALRSKDFKTIFYRAAFLRCNGNTPLAVHRPDGQPGGEVIGPMPPRKRGIGGEGTLISQFSVPMPRWHRWHRATDATNFLSLVSSRHR